MADYTPMMQQYREMKAKNPDSILFFRLGDFYEMFDDDAYTASRELDLTLTTRDRNKETPEDRTPMCGVPYHSCEAYIARLIARGYKVAVCEQLEDPAKAKGLVKRDIVRVITPGTVIEGSMLEEGRSNYICAIYLDSQSGGVCFCDMSTGETCVTSFTQDIQEHILNELGRFLPAEAVVSHGAAEDPAIADFLKTKLRCPVEQGREAFDYMQAAMMLCDQFAVQSPEELGLADDHAAICATGALLIYLRDTQKNDLHHISRKKFKFYTAKDYMELDLTARRCLELTELLQNGERRGSLLSILDCCQTAMGRRLLRAWMERPLLSTRAINQRLDAVEELTENTVLREELRQALGGVRDMERLLSRIVYGSANARDLQSLAISMTVLPPLRDLLQDTGAALLQEAGALYPLTDLADLIDRAICDDPPIAIREGGLIRTGYNAQVDELRALVTDSRSALAKIEADERERTGIKKLKAGYNRVFGYYIEIPRSASEAVPAGYIRKQTLANAERFITQELKELEAKLLTAGESLAALELELFHQLRETVSAQVERIQATAQAVAQLDVLADLAEVAVNHHYCRPEVDHSFAIDIQAGRHPVVENALTDGLFVANDTHLDAEGDRVAIITGPNMAGKSTYMRQTALIALLAHMGSFVPAKSARIGLIDRIFTRIGASDDLAAGRSTFMVEMSEVAEILKNATRRSLIILDEVGRGTSTFDGMAIARAVVEYCADKSRLGAKTLFSTHYHELTALESQLDGVRNYNITAKKRGKDIIFLRKIVPGGADESYGIEVARLAGVPEPVIRRAKTVLTEMEAARPAPEAPPAENQVSLLDLAGSQISQRLEKVDIDTLTPLEALNLLSDLKKLL